MGSLEGIYSGGSPRRHLAGDGAPIKGLGDIIRSRGTCKMVSPDTRQTLGVTGNYGLYGVSSSVGLVGPGKDRVSSVRS